MKREPDTGNLTLVIHGPPKGNVIPRPVGDRQGWTWPCIEYHVAVMSSPDQFARTVWRGPYYLGVDHVQPGHHGFVVIPRDAKRREQAIDLFQDWAAKESAKNSPTPFNVPVWADVAADAACSRKVAPDLLEVLHSLLLEGSAFFDTQSFEDWAATFDYNPDSRAAYAAYEVCRKIGRRMVTVLGLEEIEFLRSQPGWP